MRKRTLVLTGLFVVLCVVVARPQSDYAAQARHIFDLTNRDRVARGLQPLHWDTSLAAAAQAHAQRMAGESYLSHEYPGEGDVGMRAARAGAHFQAIAENVATGYSDEAIEVEWMNSTPHRRNILDPQMNSIGVGIVGRRGNYYAVEDFAQASEDLSSAQVERRIGALLRSENIDPSAPREAAALACSSNSGYPRGETGRLVVRFDTPDLSHLPGTVETQIRSGRYHKAAVAACSGVIRQGNFTTYSVAIVLY